MKQARITLGFSSCPNDTFMLAALVNKWIDTRGLDFDVSIEDVETLNEWAGGGRLDITKMSFSRFLSLGDQYRLLSSGAALGHGCGPLVIARNHLDNEEIHAGTVALPGKWTTANLLFSIFFPEAVNRQFMRFDEIEDAVLKSRTSAGVIIHENRFTYERRGLVKITDLGEAWETLTGLPIPLGGLFTSARLPSSTHNLVESLIRESITFAHDHTEKVMPWVKSYAQELDEDVIRRHIDLYVNDFSLDLGEKGLESVARLKKMYR